MMQVLPQRGPDDLDTFLDFLYEGLEGYIYVAAKDPIPVGAPDDWEPEWEKAYFEYPEQLPAVKRVIQNASASHEVYIAPALFKKPGNSKRENYKCSNVTWADFDGNAPEWNSYEHHPSVIIQSSLADRQHVYWRLTEPITDPDVQDDINRRIAYNHQADLSGWDSVQVLRPPGTLNHKRTSSVKLVYNGNVSYQNGIFDTLAPAPKEDTYTWELGELPNVEHVLLKYALSNEIIDLLALENPSEGNGARAKKLMQAAYACCQSSMNDNEVFVVVKYLADKWGKFKDRNDKDKRIASIVSKARIKYPQVDLQGLPLLPGQMPVNPNDEDEPDESPIFLMNYRDFMQAEIEIDWVIEGMLMERGNMLMAGPSGVGKTQLSLQFMKHVALGKDYLHYKIDKPRKIGFLSLEMGHPDLRVFMDAQDKDLNDAERELLSRNLEIIPLGEPWALNLEAGQSLLEEFIKQQEWEGIFVDSIGSSILGNINSSEVVQSFTNFNDRIRNRYGIFTWYIHHTRKAAPGQGGPSSQDDVYGDQYLVNRCTSAYGVLFAKDENVRIRNFKNRLAKREFDYILERTENINFTKVMETMPKLPGQGNEEPPGDTAHNGISL